jgi:hypothetical protein
LAAHPNLSFEQAPSISVPFRFLVTAPWFGVAAGLLLVWLGDQAVATRWSPAALALTHLLVAGFMLQAMTGALFQFVPVAAGGNVWRPALVAGIVHPALLVAAVLLVAGFLSGIGELFRLAAAIFLPTVAFLVAVIGTALLRTPARGATVRALRLAIGGLAVTVLLGTLLAEGLAAGHAWPLAAMTNVHAAWGLGAWALMLLAGVSYFVVPMFQLTPPYPDRFARALPIALLATVVGWSLQLLGAGSGWMNLIWFIGLSLAAAYGAATLRLQFRRRRRVTDPTFWFFRGAMGCLLAVVVSAVVFAVVPTVGEDPRSAWWFGVLILPGVFVSAINGMTYKIVPFLSWLHLQRLMGLGSVPPNMRDMISAKAMSGQLRLHFFSVSLLLVATFWPRLAGPAGMMFALSCGWLGVNLIRAVRVYCGFRDRIAAGAASQAP